MFHAIISRAPCAADRSLIFSAIGNTLGAVTVPSFVHYAAVGTSIFMEVYFVARFTPAMLASLCD